MAVSLKFRGLCAPVFQIFNKDLSINTELIPKYAKFLASNGVKGVLVHGTSGEGMSLSVPERKAVLEHWAKAVKETKQHLMVQVGGCPVPDVLDLANHAEQSGVDSILCLPELYFRPANSKELTKYLRLVGEAAPKTPLLYYHIPVRSGVNINMAQFIPEAGQNLPTFQGIKYTSNDLDAGIAAVNAADGKYGVFIGAHTLLAPAFSMGFDSSIATVLNMFPQLANGIIEATAAGKLKAARNIQESLTAAGNAVIKHGDWIPAMKAAMSLVTPIDVGIAREPQNNLPQEKINEMKKSLQALNVI